MWKYSEPKVREAYYEQNISSKLEKYGHIYIYRYAVREKRCWCWNKQTRTADPKCPMCLGMGFPYQEYLVKLFGSRSTNTTASAMLEHQTLDSVHYTPFMRFLAPREISPRIEDTVVDIDRNNGDIYRQVLDEYSIYGSSKVVEGKFRLDTGAIPGIIYGSIYDINDVVNIEISGRTIGWEIHSKQRARS